MAFWPTFFHRSDADDSLARSLRGLRENVVAMQVVLGNESTENSVVHDVKVLKNDAEMDKEQDRELVSRMDSMKAASDQLREDVETVRKMEGPTGERGEKGEQGPRGKPSLFPVKYGFEDDLYCSLAVDLSMFNNITRSGSNFDITDSTDIRGPFDGRRYVLRQNPDTSIIKKYLGKTDDGLYYIKQEGSEYSLETDFDYGRLITNNTDITLIAVWSTPRRRSSGFARAPISIYGSGAAVLSLAFLPAVSDRVNNDRFRMGIPTRIHVITDEDINSSKLNEAAGVSTLGGLASKTICMMLERDASIGSYKIYINGVEIYSVTNTGPVVSNTSGGSIRIGALNAVPSASHSKVFYGAVLLRKLTSTERIQFVEALREKFKF